MPKGGRIGGSYMLKREFNQKEYEAIKRRKEKLEIRFKKKLITH